MQTRVSLDRFEGDDDRPIAVLVLADGRTLNVPRDLLPPDAASGDSLTLTLERDARATEAVRKKTRAVRARLRKSDPGGDIKL
ncbi:DUF3006 domain-containing protein [Tundrisphaera sp. TA3]|uniref:DUF3006 domain-containing protein n=1 Tax=Tundrisphaera sp. TA3 TaxID=3435775 RepID=UPI003EBB093D